MSDPVFFESWAAMLRVIVVGIIAYASLVVMLRISGKRTLGKMNAFDIVVTVALGSILATMLLNKTVPLFEGILAFCLLTGLQFAITWLSVRSDRFRKYIKSDPTLLVHDGRYLDEVMRRQRVTRGEVGSALRESGKTEISEVRSVILEADGTMSVVLKPG